MPAGMDHPELGAIAFGVTKLVGYCVAAHLISKCYKKNPSQWFVIGMTRTIIGIAFGYPYVHMITPALGSPLFLLGLIPLRMIEWLLLIMLFYDRRLNNRRRALAVSITWMIWSFVLDIPAIAGWFVIGGFWIC
ncbi:hypothetical protein [Prosthecobacter vanneervenii]|uniref:Uncharacterized protein n=1 Tax=Prosthecobacter vanneervenii TaxID=48466 RepID=A0A7W8DLM4_9BACT|nr:hypothetical protein [Prosthecobacter vanneervenii]MBB5034534.1 hypothetical protein [Prosthecobacter vanneervenii]